MSAALTPDALAALPADMEAARDKIAAILSDLAPYERCQVTLFVRTPQPRDDILMTSDNLERLQAALLRRLGAKRQETKA